MRSLIGVMLSLVILAQPAIAAPPAADHPILGIWKLTLPDGSCSEVYRFRGDGTTLVTSAEEIAQSEFNILPQPSAKGFYKLEDRLVKDNGKKDCVGQITKAGAKATHFVHFHPSGALFLMCASESLEACIGPFRRMQGQET
ncbi:hypothetical protein [Massilia sp. TSP1-1-2]|uniref:hypothetical protein n=1 Tax=unclassified Massilia TaxID=2609279 RepID=UPI003CF59AFD